MLATCGKNSRFVRNLEIFSTKFLFKVKFWVSSKFYILENNLPYGSKLTNEHSIILAYMETYQCTCSDVISLALHHACTYTAATICKKVWVIYVYNACAFALMCISVLRFSCYIRITNKAAHALSMVIMMTIKWKHWHSSIFNCQNFPNPDLSNFPLSKFAP